ncbi:MAG: [FeFe] hydrogenase H-cluster maturation GTPase HydF [Clostridiales bacterium]|nr:[FeFe] hydrogenase H-cluster maturation GTPase HydF [Clostridiales bacterium]
MSTLNETPRSERVHIAFFGRRNSGKSSLINAFAGHKVALVSDVAGTTTDPVYKSMEIHGIGPCVLIDTAGYDDEGMLGEMRVELTRRVLKEADAAVLLISSETDPADPLTLEKEWVDTMKDTGTPVLCILSRSDLNRNSAALAAAVQEKLGLEPETASVSDKGITERLRLLLLRLLPENLFARTIASHLVNPGDTVLLVMPQDIQAPQGRLILPQVQTIRDLLDGSCVVVSATADRIDDALAALKAPPALIITDSQVFPMVYSKKPAESALTSFSVLMAAYKGDINAFVAGAETIDRLTADSRVLIAEACTHAPLEEDIGRVKLPRMLKKRFGESLRVDHVSGKDFPADLSQYDLIIHCGACMFNRRYVLSRIAAAQAAGVPITNYGVAIAKISGIIDKVSY